MTFQNKRLAIILGAAAFLLCLPAVAMRFTNEVNWSRFDFLVAGSLLFSAGLTCELVLRKFAWATYRIAICGVVIAALVLIWAELAVGIFDTPLAGS